MPEDLVGWHIVVGPMNTGQTYECIHWCKITLNAAEWEYVWKTGMFSFMNEADVTMFKLVFDYGKERSNRVAYD